MADRKQTFTPEFRAEAVRLAQTSGRSRRAVAADLGVGLSTLRNWIDGQRDREMDNPPADRQGGKVLGLPERGDIVDRVDHILKLGLQRQPELVGRAEARA